MFLDTDTGRDKPDPFLSKTPVGTYTSLSGERLISTQEKAFRQENTPNYYTASPSKNLKEIRSSTLLRPKIPGLSVPNHAFLNESLNGSKSACLSTASKLSKEDVQSILKKLGPSNRRREMLAKIGAKKKVSSALDDVKQLDTWQLERTKQKMQKFDTEYKDMLKPTIRVNKEQSNVSFPSINMNVIDRILKDADEDDELKKRKEDHYNHVKVLADTNASNKALSDLESKDSHKSLEVRIRENRDEIANNFVLKKVRQFFKPEDVETMTPENLKSHIELIAKSALAQFKSFKEVNSRDKVENCVKIMTDNAKPEEDDPFSLPHLKQAHKPIADAELIINYKDIETMLYKDIEKTNDRINQCIWRRSDLAAKTKKLLKEVNEVELKLAQVIEKSKEAPSISSGQNSPTSKKVRDARDSTATAGSETSKMSKEYLQKLNKFKNEIKLQKLELSHQLEEAKRRYFVSHRELENTDNEIKSKKEHKTKAKMQLRNLYLDLLKDELNIMRSKNSPSYSWVIHSLWNMKQEVDEEAFPAFLDKESVYYLHECAKLQMLLYKYCLENNILHKISDSEGFQQGNPKDIALFVEGALAKTPNVASLQKIDSDDTNRLEERSFNNILNNFQNRMRQMKMENLQIKAISHSSTESGLKLKSPPNLRYLEADQNNVNTNKPAISYRNLPNLLPAETPLAKASSKKELRAEVFKIGANTDEKQVVQEILKEIENLRRAEKERIFKSNMTKDFDLARKESLLKAFIFLFGTKEGNDHSKTFFQENRHNLQRLKGSNYKVTKSTVHKTIAPAEKTFNTFEAPNNHAYKLASTMSNGTPQRATPQPMTATANKTSFGFATFDSQAKRSSQPQQESGYSPNKTFVSNFSPNKTASNYRINTIV